MYIIKFVLVLLLGLSFGFGLWYLIFWFITNEPNLFTWHWITKIVYLFFGFLSAGGIIESILKEID